MNNNQNIWNSLHTEDRHRTKYPSEEAIRFIMGKFQRDGRERFLDMGCGAGRHVMLAAVENIIPYGVDFSHEGVVYTRSMLSKNGFGRFADNVVECGVDKLPFENEFFDGIMCFGVLYYLNVTGINNSIKEMYRVMKKGGHGMVLIRNTEDYRCIDAVKRREPEVEERTYYVQGEGSEKSACKENGMIMHFFTLSEVKRFFSDFSDLEINTVSIGHNNDEYKDCDFLVTFTK